MAGGKLPPSTPSERRKGTDPSGTSGKDPCDLTFTTSLANVRTSNSADLRVGIDLRVAVENSSIVCLRADRNEAVGTIFSRHAQSLVDCINGGNDYIAKITDFDYGHIEVRVSRK